ncbi:hypothetical protein Tco_1162660 [Tanacetum coccineum]
MYRIATSTTQNREPQLPHASRNTNPHVSTSTGVNHSTSVSRPPLKSYQVKDKVVPNNSQVKFTKKEVEDYHRIYKKTKSVTAYNDSSNSKTSNVNAVCAECTSFNGQKQQRIDLNADALYNVKQENLRVWLLKMLISKKPVPECYITTRVGITIPPSHSNAEDNSDTNVFTMKMEILLEPASNKLLDAAQVTVNEDKTTDGACYLELKVPSRSRRDGWWDFRDRYGYRYDDGIASPQLPSESDHKFISIFLDLIEG